MSRATNRIVNLVAFLAAVRETAVADRRATHAVKGAHTHRERIELLRAVEAAGAECG